MITRGPIEAQVSIPPSLNLKVFPRVITRGPIEANPSACSIPPGSRFPRVITRGPIEAKRRPQRSYESLDFRG